MFKSKPLVALVLVLSMLLSISAPAFAQQLPVDDVELSDSVQVNSEDEISDDNSDDSQQEVSDVQEEEINDNPTEEVSIIDFSATESVFFQYVFDRIVACQGGWSHVPFLLQILFHQL